LVPQFPEIELDEYVPTIIDLETQDQIIAAIPEENRGAFLAARLGLRPGGIVALNVQDFREGCLLVSKARKGPYANAPIRGTKTRRARVVEADGELADWIAKHRGKRDRSGSAVRECPRRDTRKTVDREGSPLGVEARR
jgi:hypothetical protein